MYLLRIELVLRILEFLAQMFLNQVPQPACATSPGLWTALCTHFISSLNGGLGQKFATHSMDHVHVGWNVPSHECEVLCSTGYCWGSEEEENGMSTAGWSPLYLNYHI